MEPDLEDEHPVGDVNPEPRRTVTWKGDEGATEAAQPAGRIPPALKQYEIVRELGRGGMGTVYLARDTKLGRLVAIKVLIEHTGQGVERFLAEARATARCKHENIVGIHEVDELGGHPYMVLEYLEGRTLRAWMAKQAAGCSPAHAIELVMPVVRALGCAHGAGIVHAISSRRTCS